MINNITDISDVERGMTGIGVLILFIALVLVAAIASGLILDTAGVLQNTAQNTGEQSTSEVSDRLSVLSASGDVEAVDDTYEVTVFVDDGSGGNGFSTVSAAEVTAPDGSTYDMTGEAADTDGDGNNDAYVLEVANNASYDFLIEDGAGTGDTGSVTVDGSDESITLDITAQAVTADGTTTAAPQPLGPVEAFNEVTELGLTVYRSPGADDVDLQHATIEYFSPSGTAFLIHQDEFDALSTDELNNDFSANLGAFHTEAVKDDDGSVPVLNSRDDRASMIVDLYKNPDGSVNGQPASMDYLSAGDSATLRLTTQSGATTTQIVNVPESLAGYAGSTVML